MPNNSPTSAGRQSSRQTRPTRSFPLPFVWRPRDWIVRRQLNSKVSLLESRTSRLCVVKKVLPISQHNVHDRRPLEVRILSKLPNCNRVVRPIFFSESDPDALHATVIFAHYRLGDLGQWVDKNFWSRNQQPVPESCIWRFFVQISQGLAFVQNKIGPFRDRRKCLIIRDIKPENILVAENGTTYPSFKLHDFDCAGWYEEGNERLPFYCGSFMWQPPENPIINTTAGEIWALGACVHFMAVGLPPLGDVNEHMKALMRTNGARPESTNNYRDLLDYSFAHVPRQFVPINLSRAQQQQLGIQQRRHQYSDALNQWMAECLSQNPNSRPTVIRLIQSMSIMAREILRQIGGQSALVDLDIKFGPDV